jgi:phosphatidylserine/phosphatidylglycerophosphate/cardiolipin synthase-like enzyme
MSTLCLLTASSSNSQTSKHSRAQLSQENRHLMLLAQTRPSFRVVSRLKTPSSRWQSQRGHLRSFNSSSATSLTSSSAAKSPFSVLGSLTNELDKLSPRIEIDPLQIEILKTPEEFYEKLKDKIRKAKRHIYLSTLYVGTTEHELVSLHGLG